MDHCFGWFLAESSKNVRRSRHFVSNATPKFALSVLLSVMFLVAWFAHRFDVFNRAFGQVFSIALVMTAQAML